MMIIGFIIVIMILLISIYLKEKKIKKISSQVNDILFQQKSLYIQQYKEGSLSILECEIMKLINRLNEQTNLLSEDKLLLKNSLEDISHQMKTPLTSLNLIHERLKNAEGIDKKNLLKEQELVIYKMEWLVSSLLKMAQIDSKTVDFKREVISNHNFINQLVKVFEIQLELKNMNMVIDIDDGNLNIDILWTLEALSNILKNSIDHIEDHGTIKIMMKHNLLYDEIIIQDDGPGIDKEDLKHLFERFYKGKNANKKSVGIGLALSKMIVESQNGTITVENSYPGAKFTIHFYKETI